MNREPAEGTARPSGDAPFLHRRHIDCQEIVANDLCRLRELYHPDKHEIGVSHSLAHAVVPPGTRTLRHHLVDAVETYYILSGAGRMHIGAEVFEVLPGDAIVIPANAIQFIENNGETDLAFLAVVEPAWMPEIDIRDE